MKIFCFGNEFIENDALAKHIADDLIKENINIIKCNSPEDMITHLQGNEEIIIIDVVKDIKEVMIIDNVDKLKTKNTLSTHDLDLSFMLKLMKNMNMLTNIKIIGIPMQGNKEEIKEKVRELLTSIC